MSLITAIPKAAIGTGLKVARLPIDAALRLTGTGNGRAESLHEASEERIDAAEEAAERRHQDAERRRRQADRRAERSHEKAQRERHESKERAKPPEARICFGRSLITSDSASVTERMRYITPSMTARIICFF